LIVLKFKVGRRSLWCMHDNHT